MKITAINTCILTIPMQREMKKQFAHHKLVVAEISTDEGITGLGTTLGFGGGNVEAIQVYLETRLKPALIGKDPLYVQRLWDAMTRGESGKKHGLVAFAISAIDIGLWDIVGKVAKMPLYKIWGAVNDRIPAYGSGGFVNYSIDDLINEAKSYVAMGCKYYKMKIHHPDPRENRKRVEAVRRALGDGVRVMVDVNQRHDVHASIEQARMLEDLDLLWYEEPVNADDVAACAEVARSIRIPVATGENAYTRYEFRDLIEARAARYLMPDVQHANGFSETLRIAALAQANQLIVSPHLAHELSIHVVGALSNGFLVEFMDWIPTDLFEYPLQCVEGCFQIPERPGHGVVLAPGAKEKYQSV
ncbi:MAG: mandelate racemase/muconate lactonizing enzyme family protein [Burkholderiales bacterium]